MQSRFAVAGSVFSVTLVLALPLLAQSQQQLDSTTADPQHHKVVFENDQVRVVHYLIGPGETTPKHSHPDNVAIFLTDATAKITTEDGKSQDVQRKAGTAGWRPATTHVFQNTGNKPIEGILVEPKSPHSARPAGSADETLLPGGNGKVEFENELIRVVHYRIEPGQRIAMHGHPENVQIALTDSTAESTSPENKTTTTSIKAGEVLWRPALQHSVVNTGSTPIEGFLVEMKGAPKAASE